MQGSRSRWVSKAAAKALVASLVAVAGIGIIAVPEAFAATPTVTCGLPDQRHDGRRDDGDRHRQRVRHDGLTERHRGLLRLPHDPPTLA